jgi:response regulator of citrate/malate metabolism
MARLPEGEKQRRLRSVSRLLNRCRVGLTEQEVSQEMGWDRRTTNNYLRELDDEEKVHRNGRKWFPG